MRLRPGVRVLWRAPGEVQVGTDPRWALRLTGLLPAEERALGALERGAATTAPAGVEAPRWAELLEPLQRAGLVVGARDAGPHDAAADRRCVAVVGLGRIGALVAQGLAAAGVHLLLDDPGRVLVADVGPGGYRRTDVGLPREQVVARLVHDGGGSVTGHAVTGHAVTGRVGTAPEAEPDLVVLVDSGVAAPGRARALMAHGLMHLSVVAREGDVLVGPLVVPGRSPCLRCLDLHRTDADGRWPVVATQLAVPPRPPWGTCASPVGAGSPAGPLVAAGVAVGQVIAALGWAGGGAVPATLGTTVEVDGADGLAVVRQWTAHTACGCSTLDGSERHVASSG